MRQGLNRKLGIGGQPIQAPVNTDLKALEEGGIDHFWHPDRDGVEQAPEWFAAQLREITHDVLVCRPPAGAPLYYRRAWLLWYRKPSMTHYLSPGWLMLREWRDVRGEPLPLDGRVFSYLYSVSAKQFGSAKKYFEHCLSEMAREKAAKEKAHTDDNHDRGEDYRKSMQISNLGNGSKFALHHDGTVHPSRGQRNWLAERRQRMIPGDVVRDERARAEQARG